MRDAGNWVEYVSRHLSLPGLHPSRRAEIVEELAQQIEQRYREGLDQGLNHGEAESVARNEVSDWERLSSEIRRSERRHRTSRLESLHDRLSSGRQSPLTSFAAAFMRDALHGLRMLRRRPVYAAVIIVTLALGIGANTAIFSVINSILLRPLPYGDPDRLVVVWESVEETGQTRGSTSNANYLDWKSNGVFEQMAAATLHSPVVTLTDRSEALKGLRASADLFDLLQVTAHLGRTFGPEDSRSGEHRVAVLSHGCWQRVFGGDPDLIGSRVILDGEAHMVLGVMPPDFEFPPFWGTDRDVWTPLVFGTRPGDPLNDPVNRGGRYLRVFARLKQGLDLDQARAEMGTIAARLASDHPDQNEGVGIHVEPLREPVVGDVRPALLIMMGAVGFVLLIACANVGNLLLTHGLSRSGELAVRTALGAGRWRLTGQLLTESLLLSLLGGAAGFAVGYGGIEAMKTLAPPGLPRVQEIGLDLRVLVFAVLLSFVTAVLFGLVPALRATRANPRDLLNERAATATPGRARLRGLLVIAEIALALTLLIGAGLLVNSFLRLVRVNPGFVTENVLTMGLSFKGPRYESTRQQDILFSRLEERILGLPDVDEVGFVHILHIGGDTWGFGMGAEGAEPGSGRAEFSVSPRFVTPGFFGSFGIPIRSGRTFDRGDTLEAPGVVIINRRLAGTIWPGEDPVGKRLKRGGIDSGQPWLTVVGIAGDVHQESLSHEIQFEVYFPYSQNFIPWYPHTSMIVRTGTDVANLAGLVRREVRAEDPGLPLSDVRTVEMLLFESVASERFNTLLMAAFALLALLLASVGVYGVMNYSVSRRTHEIGVRLVLGARPAEVVRLILRQGIMLAVPGVGLGILGAILASRYLASLLFDVSPRDFTTFLVVSSILLGVAVAACWFPARRASRIDPIETLNAQ